MSPRQNVNALLPPNLSDYSEIQSLGGGTESVFQIMNTQGQSLVLKFGAHPEAMQIELLCLALYKALGVSVPEYTVHQYNQLPRVLTEKLPVVLLQRLGLENPAEDLKNTMTGIFQLSEYIAPAEQSNQINNDLIIAAARQHFIKHVFIGNIDVAKLANYIVDNNGRIVLIDAGANIIFRALGEKREENPLLLSELSSLRNASVNSTAHQWFSVLTAKEIKAQVIDLVRNRDKIEKVIWDVSSQLNIEDKLRIECLDGFADRLDYLVTHYCPEEQPYAKQDKKAQVGQTAAGIFTYTLIKNKPRVLMAKRRGHSVWDNFGGKSDLEDISLADTAIRETSEESSGFLNYSDAQLWNSPFHDLITTPEIDKIFIYRMYLIKHDFIEANKFTDAEHTEYRWVLLKDLIKGISDSISCRKNMNKNAIKINDTIRKKSFLLYPPLYRMVQQQAVFSNLKLLAAGKPLKLTHTQSKVETNGKIKGKIKKIEGNLEKSLLRPIASLQQKKSQISNSLLNSSRMLREFKQEFQERQALSFFNERNKYKKHIDQQNHKNRITKQNILNNNLMNIPEPSQSELHFQAALGEAYKIGNIADNIHNMFNVPLDENELLHKNFNLTPEQKTLFVAKCVELIKAEKNNENENKIIFYHACDSQAAFAYEFFTELYRILRANDQWTIFRADNQAFSQFENITAFIKHYSKGKNNINNNDEGFSDCVLSASLFLFGHYQTPTSCSINYLFSNDVARRQFDLTIFLKNLLQPYGVRQQELNDLMKFYQTFEAQHGNALYQISVSHEEVTQFAYPAGFYGVMNKYHDEEKIVDILNILKKAAIEQNLSIAMKNYIINLQARLFASPRYELTSRKLSIQEIITNLTAEQQKIQRDLLSKKMRQLADTIAHRIFSTNNTISKRLDHHSPLLKILPYVSIYNLIPNTSKWNENILAKAIIENDNELMQQILQMTPELKKEKISYSSRCHVSLKSASNSNQININQMLPIEIILCYSTDAVNLLKKYYTSPELLDYANDETNIKLIDLKIFEFLQALPKDKYVKFIFNIKFENIINDGYRLAKILFYLSDNERIKFACKLKDKIIDVAQLAEILPYLPDDKRLGFSRELKDKIIDGSQLAKILSYLPDDKRVEFACELKNKIKNGSQLAEILPYLPDDKRLSFSRELKDNIKDIDQLVAVICHLPKDKCAAFADELKDKVKAGDQFARILSNLPDDDCAKLVRELNDKWLDGYRFVHILSALPDDKRVEILHLSKNKIKNSNQIIHILPDFPKDKHVEVVRILKDKIENGYHLASILEYANVAHKLKDEVENNNQLAYILAYVDLAYELKDIINDSDQLAAILPHLPNNKRVAFARELIKEKIKDYSALANILPHLPTDKRLAFSHEFKDKIKNGYQLAKILPHLPTDKRLEFSRELKDKIKNGSQLANILPHLPNDKLVEFAHEFEDKIENGSQLKSIIKKIPEDNKAEFAFSLQNKISNSTELEAIIKKLLEKERSNFKKSWENLFLQKTKEAFLNIEKLIKNDSQSAIHFFGASGLKKILDHKIIDAIDEMKNSTFLNIDAIKKIGSLAKEASEKINKSDAHNIHKVYKILGELANGEPAFCIYNQLLKMQTNATNKSSDITNKSSIKP